MNQMFRHIASIVLLATYLPMVVLSSVHVHHDTIDEHDDCGQCVGHVEVAHHHDHDCLYCHFLVNDYLGQDAELSDIIRPVAENRLAEIVIRAEILCHGVSLLRAPPLA